MKGLCQFMNWSEPCLPAAAAWLIDRASNVKTSKRQNVESETQRRICDLSDLLCVLPGRRAGRLLLAQLVKQCGEKNLTLIPPIVLTPGAMVDHVLASSIAITNPIEITLAWMAALRDADAQEISAFLPHRPDDTDLSDWLALADTIAKLHADLAGQRIDFAAVAEKAENMSLFGEGDRWRALTAIHKQYDRILRRNGLIDPHAAREASLAQSELRIQNSELILIGVPELNALQRAVVATFDDRATTLIHAPSDMTDFFDDYGCVIAERWADREIALREEQIVIADRPDDQAQSALRAIAAFNGTLSAADITIGLGDPAMAPSLQHAAEWAGISVRAAEGRKLIDTAPCRALTAIAEWLDDQSFANFASLLRHPDVERRISNLKSQISDSNSQSAKSESEISNLKSEIADPPAAIADWLSLLDRYYSDFLHQRITETWLGDGKVRRGLKAVHEAVKRLLIPLMHPPKQRILSDWVQPILEVMANLYGKSSGSSSHGAERINFETCVKVRDFLVLVADAATALQPRTTAAQTIELLLHHIGDEPIAQEFEDDQIEMLGWLELHLDLAPALIVTGFNEGNIPKSQTADAFLPDSLCAALGLPCNATRFARDAYLLDAINHSRSGHRQAQHPPISIAGRRNANGEPLTPSRLLLACDGETLVKRISRFCDETTVAPRAAPIGLTPSANGESVFVVPTVPNPLPIPGQMEVGSRDYMRVTEFKTYLACPYRYALGRLLNLKGIDDRAAELNALQFGDLAHEVLCKFGRDTDIRDSDDAERIERFLIRAIENEVARKFGHSPPVALRVQAAGLQQRLRSFATTQAALAAEGWRILHCELEFDRTVALEIPGQESMPLRGKIDRIDFNEKTKSWRIIDYKTSESAESPHKTHHGSERVPDPATLEWTDLQLPLYHYLATRSEHNISGDVNVAYICLPKQADGIRVIEAQWKAEHLEHAIETARQVVRDIRVGHFNRNLDFEGHDDFARICQTTTFADLEPDAEEVEA